MNSIVYTITPNPALDLGGVVDDVVPNEKNYVHDETRFAGGNSINAARILTRLGVPTVASGFLGGGVGTEVERLLRGEGVLTSFVSIEKDTRVSVTVANRKTGLQTRLSYQGPVISPAEKRTLENTVREWVLPSAILIGGSLPSGFTPKDLRRLIASVKRRRIPCFLDVPGAVLKSSIAARPDFIKPNLTEFQELIGKKIKSLEEVVSQAHELTKYVPMICVSSVAGGAILVQEKEAWFGKLPPFKTQTTVGAGDSMVGAMVAQWWQTGGGQHSAELLRMGLAGSWATLLHPGTTLGSGDEIKTLVKKIKIQKLM